MDLKIKGIEFIIDEDIENHINSKLKKLDFLEEYIIYVNFVIKKDNNKNIKVEIDSHLKWGIDIVISHQGMEAYSLVDDTINSFENKIKKEKDKRFEKKKN